jgi:hypothetical protein
MMRVFLSILLLSSTLSFAQTFGDMGTVWNTSYEFQAPAGPSNQYFSQVKNCYIGLSDTLINNKDHLKINHYYDYNSFHSNGSVNPVYEVWDSTRYVLLDSDQVFMGQPGNMKLYYDFNFELGDSLIKYYQEVGTQFFVADTINVINVDSVFYNNSYRKRIVFDSLRFDLGWNNIAVYPPMIWVEGVGDINYGSFTFGMSDSVVAKGLTSENYSLNCFVENDTSWIGNCDPFYACPWITTGLAQIHPEQFSIYPNPVQDLLQIDVLIDEEYAIHIYDLNGRLVQWNDSLIGNQILDVAGLKKGVYILEISKGESALTQRLVKL